MILCAAFNLPFRFVNEGKYDVPYTWNRNSYYTKVHIKLEQNFSVSKNIAGIEIETSERGKVDLTADEHGIINYTKVLIEFEDKGSYLDKVDKYSLLEQMHGVIKLACIQVLNKLGQLIRASTNNFWIRAINFRDIFDFQLFDNDTKEIMITMDFSQGYYFPKLEILDQAKVSEEIEEALRTDLQVHPWKDLYLDAINYFTIGRYNESIIIMNIALESFVAEHMFKKLKEGNNEDPKKEILRIFSHKFHKVMETYFERIDGRSITKQSDLWLKFDKAREIRRFAIHSFTKRFSFEESKKVLDDVMEIIHWIEQN